ncbi:hypothetical protein KJ885_00070, partial [Patescibacteria group bacterium]|nr:hypothetical protein [Patescibacteria group bacterium]
MNTRKNIRITKDDLYRIVWCAEIEKIFQESKSTMILEEDSVSVQIKLLCKGRIWLRYKLRDRSFDGPNWQSSPLTDWNYGGPDDEFILGSALEESIYCLDPRYALESMFSESQAQFIANPFEELPYDCPDEEALLVWLTRWREVFALEKPPFPGYFYLKNISGVRRKIFEKAVRCLNQNGYRYFTAVPTWWHIACMYEHLGLKYQFKEDEQ